MKTRSQSNNAPRLPVRERTSSQRGVKRRLGPSVEVSGLEQDGLESAEVKVSFPLKAGQHEWPTEHDTARLKISESTQLDCFLKIGSKRRRASTIDEARVDFSKPLVVENPASALDPSNKELGWIADRAIDMIVNAELDGVHLTPAGSIKRSGGLAVPVLGRIAPLDEDDNAADKNNLPKISRNLRTIKKKGLLAKKGGSRRKVKYHRTPKEILKAFGKVLDKSGVFEVKLATKNSRIKISPPWLGTSAAAGRSTLMAQGKVTVDKNGNISVGVKRPSEPTVVTPVGSARVWGAARARVDSEGKGKAAARVHYDAALARMSGGPVGALSAAAAFCGVCLATSGVVKASYDGEDYTLSQESGPGMRIAPRSEYQMV